MMTNLVDLRSKISMLEREYSDLYYQLKLNCMNKKAIELDGHEQVLKDYLYFDDDFEKLENMAVKIVQLKGILFEKNNSLKLSNGDTIQKAIVDVQNKRKMLELVNTLAKKEPSKTRVSETNNSYFETEELAFDKTRMIEEKEALIKQIQKIELEISQLNSEMFEI